jgi:N-acetylneuraminic acid mutarotase
MRSGRTSRALVIALAGGCLMLGGGLRALGCTLPDSFVLNGAVDPVLPAYTPPAAGGFRVFADEFTWQTATSHPIERFESNGLAAFGKLWVIGGFGKYTAQSSPRSDVYDPATDKWTRIKDMPITVTHVPAVLVGTTIWLVGGFVGDHPGPATKDVWKYDTATDTWTRGPSLPQPRGAGGAAYLDGWLHYFGGGNRKKGELGYPSETEHWALDLSNESAGWQVRAPMLVPRDHMSGATVNGAIYSIGGALNGDEHEANQKRVERYDPGTDKWTRVADMPTARSHITSSTFVAGGKIIVAGGTNNGNIPSRDVAAYDPVANTWQVLPKLPSGRKSPVMGAIDHRIVSATGYNGTGTKTVWISSPIGWLTSPDAPQLPQPPEPEPPVETTPTTPTVPTTQTVPETPTTPSPPPTPSPPQGDGATVPPQTVVPQVKPPATEPGGHEGGKVTLSVTQIRINQRISQAAVRRVNELIAAVTGKPGPKPHKPGKAVTVELTVGQLRINQRISQAALRRVAALERILSGQSGRATTERPGKGRVTLTARQLLINQRISQAAVRRVNALAEMVAAQGG